MKNQIKSKVRKTFDLKPKKPLNPEKDSTVSMNKDVVKMIGGKKKS